MIEYEVPPFTVSSIPKSGIAEYEIGVNYPNHDGDSFIFLGYIKGTDTPMWRAIPPLKQANG
jgi:hypothetical protein